MRLPCSRRALSLPSLMPMAAPGPFCLFIAGLIEAVERRRQLPSAIISPSALISASVSRVLPDRAPCFQAFLLPLGAPLPLPPCIRHLAFGSVVSMRHYRCGKAVKGGPVLPKLHSPQRPELGPFVRRCLRCGALFGLVDPGICGVVLVFYGGDGKNNEYQQQDSYDRQSRKPDMPNNICPFRHHTPRRHRRWPSALIFGPVRRKHKWHRSHAWQEDGPSALCRDLAVASNHYVLIRFGDPSSAPTPESTPAFPRSLQTSRHASMRSYCP